MLKSKINRYYEQHDCERISQGDILRDLKFIIIGEDNSQIELEFQHIVVVSQDCDLEQGSKFLTMEKKEDIQFNQYLHNILLLPAFQFESIKEGRHLIDLYNIKTERINSKASDTIRNNNNPRYHFLPRHEDFQVPDLLIDFKAYYTLPLNWVSKIYKKHYLVTINEIFRESLSQRFAYYLNRIGLPNL